MSFSFRDCVLWDEFKKERIPSYEYFIACFSSDDRAYTSLLNIIEVNPQIKCLIFDFQTRIYNSSLRDNIITSNKLDVSLFECHESEVSDNIINFFQRFNFIRGKEIVIDLSCFTKPYIFTIIKYIKDNNYTDHITILYTEPLSYTFPNGLLTIGNHRINELTINEIHGYSGIGHSDNRILIIVLGFEQEIADDIIEEICPLEVYAINGFPGYDPKYKDLSLIANSKILPRQETEVCFCRANNPFDIINFLNEFDGKNRLHKKYGNNYSITIAPLGTKPMSLGCCLYAISNPSIRVVYPEYKRTKFYEAKDSLKTWVYRIFL